MQKAIYALSESLLRAMLARAPWMAARLAGERHLPEFLSVFASRFGLRTVEVTPLPGSRLARGQDGLRLRVDSVILPAVLESGAWQYDEVQTMADLLDRNRQYTLVDVGANAGLISRQALLHVPQIAAAECFEPDPTNFACLQHNLAGFPRVAAHNIALGDQDGTMELFLDKTNSGNFSLSSGAMEGHEYNVEVVQVRAAHALLQQIMVATPQDRHFIYKSDTQGYDEYIAALLPDGFWSRVDVVVMEISRMQKPVVDADRFRALLESFPHRRFGHDKAEVQVDEVIAFAMGPTDNRYVDLVLWR
jgi:FkbM family methyltransferase